MDRTVMLFNILSSIKSFTDTFLGCFRHILVEIWTNLSSESAIWITERAIFDGLAICRGKRQRPAENGRRCNHDTPQAAACRARNAIHRNFTAEVREISACFSFSRTPTFAFKQNKGPPAHHPGRNDPVTCGLTSPAEVRTGGIRWEFSIARGHAVYSCSPSPWCGSEQHRILPPAR